ncbi:MAG: phage holin family protein [Sphingobacteriaceae bacterium]|nr:phage holin family protein [Sphingobacteriaceae bacterium]
MADQKNIESIIADTKVYLDNRLDYIRLVVLEKTAKFFANLVSNTLLLVFFGVFILFGSLTLGFYLSQIWGSYTLGFAAVTGIYLLLFVVLLLLKGKVIEKRLADFFVKMYFNKIEDKKDEK